MTTHMMVPKDSAAPLPTDYLVVLFIKCFDRLVYQELSNGKAFEGWMLVRRYYIKSTSEKSNLLASKRFGWCKLTCILEVLEQMSCFALEISLLLKCMHRFCHINKAAGPLPQKAGLVAGVCSYFCQKPFESLCEKRRRESSEKASICLY